MLIEISAGFMLLMFGILWITGKIKQRKYEEDYVFVASCIRYWTVSPQTYHKIVGMLTRLSLDSANDPEKVKQLYKEFKDRFADYDKEFRNDKILINQN
jgi:hypothetical protein